MIEEKGTIPRLSIEALDDIYTLMEQVRSDEISAAARYTKGSGYKAATIRLQVKLAKIVSLCQIAHRDIATLLTDAERKRKEAKEKERREG